jgi:hypothetical protein
MSVPIGLGGGVGAGGAGGGGGDGASGGGGGVDGVLPKIHIRFPRPLWILYIQ